MTQQEHLAPVTYLFGAPAAPAAPPSSRVEPPSRVEPVETAQRVEPVETAQRVEPVETPTPETLADIAARIAEIEATPSEPLETPSSRPENISMHALARRGMSVAEMRALLTRRELEPEQVEAEVARLERVGLLDDRALAETLVQSLYERKGLGRSAIAAELRRRQVDPAAIDLALQVIDSDDELGRAIEVAEKRANQLRSYDPETARRRLGAYLQRRGYSGSILSAAMESALSAHRGGGVQFR
jgi:regulatory protein